MRPTDDIDDYCADPVGKYLLVPNGMAFCASPHLWGWSMWGRPSKADVGRIVRLLTVELGPSVMPHAGLADLRYLEDANPSAFILLARFLRENARAIAGRMTEVALVRPGGFLGMVVAGFHDVVGAPYPLRVFDDLSAAAACLNGVHIAAELETVISRSRQTSSSIARLRAWLDDNVASATLGRAARALARATRSLQRDLRAVNSSFQCELDEARIRRAKSLLARTQKSLTEIAYDVGCASPQHFSVVFRRRLGMSPSAWRALHRAG